MYGCLQYQLLNTYRQEIFATETQSAQRKAFHCMSIYLHKRSVTGKSITCRERQSLIPAYCCRVASNNNLISSVHTVSLDLPQRRRVTERKYDLY